MNVEGNLYWLGKQWYVDDRGISTIDEAYFIDKNRLVEEEVIKEWNWMRQLAEKN